MSDIIAITDSNKNIVAEYHYDPWGKVTSVTGSNTTIGNLNPFRYRSYYYDFDIQMYYLQSRYYDLKTGRFLNCDDVNYIGLLGTVDSYNAFAYCCNNFSNLSDPSGRIAVTFKHGYFDDDYTSEYYGGDEYTYNSSVKASLKNKFMGSAWKTAAKVISKLYPDGYKFYMHYRDGNGMPLLYNYGAAINEDSNIKNYINELIKSFMKYVESQKLKLNKNYAFSSKLDINVSVAPKTLNWKLAIGAHTVAITADVKQITNNKYTTDIYILAFDRYNFSSGDRFLKIIPGSWNGELVTCGMAKNYTSIGLAYYTFSWSVGAWKNANNFTYY